MIINDSQISQSYRKIVLKALPRLQKLDNIEVTPEEVSDAVRNPIPQHQPKREEVYEEQYQEPPNYQQQQQSQPPQQQYRQPSPIREVSVGKLRGNLYVLCFHWQSHSLFIILMRECPAIMNTP